MFGSALGEVALRPEQRTELEKLAAAADARHAGMAEGKKALESFRTDKFDANAAAPSPHKVRVQATAGSSRIIGMAETVLPILTPEQRRIVADKIRQMAASGADMPFEH